jgi:hypothetical protein
MTEEINKLVRELYDFAADESTLAGVPLFLGCSMSSTKAIFD